MNEFGTKAYSKALRWIMRISAGVLFGAFIATWAVLLGRWSQLDALRVYLYMGVFLAYIFVERGAFRGPDEDAYTEHMWVRYVLTYAWWFLVLGALLEHAYTQRNQPLVTIAGIVLCLVGLALSYWGKRTLTGELGQRVDTWREMRIIESGPYRLIRHPAYLGSMLVVLGLPLIVNAYIALVLSALLIFLFARRILFEERTLADRLPAYAAYVQRTHRLIPGIW